MRRYGKPTWAKTADVKNQKSHFGHKAAPEDDRGSSGVVLFLIGEIRRARAEAFPGRLFQKQPGRPKFRGDQAIHAARASEQAGDFPILVHVDFLRGWDLRQPRHGHDLPRQRY